MEKENAEPLVELNKKVDEIAEEMKRLGKRMDTLDTRSTYREDMKGIQNRVENLKSEKKKQQDKNKETEDTENREK